MATVNSPKQIQGISSELLYQKDGVLKNYLHLRGMEVSGPKQYPEDTALRYLRVSHAISERSVYEYSDKQVVDLFSTSSKRWFFLSMKRLATSGKLQRQGQLNRYCYRKVHNQGIQHGRIKETKAA